MLCVVKRLLLFFLSISILWIYVNCSSAIDTNEHPDIAHELETEILQLPNNYNSSRFKRTPGGISIPSDMYDVPQVAYPNYRYATSYWVQPTRRPSYNYYRYMQQPIYSYYGASRVTQPKVLVTNFRYENQLAGDSPYRSGVFRSTRFQKMEMQNYGNTESSVLKYVPEVSTEGTNINTKSIQHGGEAFVGPLSLLPQDGNRNSLEEFSGTVEHNETAESRIITGRQYPLDNVNLKSSAFGVKGMPESRPDSSRSRIRNYKSPAITVKGGMVDSSGGPIDKYNSPGFGVKGMPELPTDSLRSPIDINREKRNENRCYKLPKIRNGHWSYFNNSSPPDSANSVESSGTVVVYECDNGFLLSTNNEKKDFIVCQDNKWNFTSNPSCKQRCATFYNTSILTVKCKNKFSGEELPCDKATSDTYLEYKCSKYYAPSTLTRTILQCSDGNWNYKQLPLCVPDCGRKKLKAIPLINGGTISELGKYPWVVALYSNLLNIEYSLICGGSLLSTDIVLSAAHCVSRITDGKPYKAYHFRVCAGKFYKDLEDPRDANTTQTARISKLIVHEEYKGESQHFRYDIVLLKLENHFTLTDHVQPVCFRGVRKTVPIDILGWVAGWGFTSPSGNQSDVLKEVDMPIRERETCYKEFDKDWANHFLTDEKLCAGHVNKSTSVCRGDSGGGLVLQHEEDRKYYIYGIVSLGHSFKENNTDYCSIQKTALFTKISHYSNWIEEKVAYSSCDRCKNIREGLRLDQCDFCYCTQRFCPVDLLDVVSGTGSRSGFGCETPAQPENGIWRYKNNNITGLAGLSVNRDTTLYFKCNTGYILSPNIPFVTCENTGWSVKVMPECKQLCPLVNMSTGAIKCKNTFDVPIDCEFASEFSYYTVNCPAFYEGSSTTPTYCIQGAWGSGETLEPRCDPVCGVLNSPASENTTVSQFKNPWAVLIYRATKNNNDFLYVCGGTLLSPDVVLTAAQCVTAKNGSIEDMQRFRVAAGSVYNIYLDSRDIDAQYSEIERAVVHEHYIGRSKGFKSDIALIKLKKQFIINSAVVPVCLKKLSTSTVNGSVGSMTGWGYIQSGKQSKRRIELDFPLIDRTACSNAFENSWSFQFLSPDKICAGSLTQELDLCTGDTGAGLIFKDPTTTKYYIRGVAGIWNSDNFFDECQSGTVRIFTDVMIYYDWIKQQLSSLSQSLIQ